jgi:ABC-type nitrate/sulfonate/bicarbonate transport system permease component
MLTARRHRNLTRWPRRLAFALVILLLLAASWRAYHALQPRHLPAPGSLVQAV